MKYIKKFPQHSNYQAFISGGEEGVDLPNVSYCENENEVHYNPIQSNNEIWYTSSNGNIVTLSFNSTTPFLDAEENDIAIVSNTYKNGKGVIKLEKDCYQLGGYVFSNCTTLKSITIPNSVTSIGQSAFSSCSNLINITIPNSVTSIGTNAFNNCRSLTSITIPNLVTSIRWSAFNNCKSLTSITIPNLVRFIEGNAFYNCTKLSNITIQPETPPTLGRRVFDGIAANAVIYVPSGSVDAYKTADNWSTYADKIQAIAK